MTRSRDRHPSRAPRRTVALACAALLAAAPARAADTQWWIADAPADHARSESRGVVVRADGALELGPAAASAAADSLDVVWALAVLADGSVALAGAHGRIDRWTEREGVRPWVRLPVGQVLSLAVDGDRLLAGTGPDGLVYRIGARGDTALAARTGERYVWGIAPAGRDAWWLATGTRGRLLKLEAGRVRTVHDSDESNLVSLTPDGRGGAFAGGDSKGRIYHARADQTVRTVFDASEDEVRGLALAPDGALYAAALSAQAVTGADGDDDGPAPVKSAVTGGRAVVYRVIPDSVVQSWWTSPHPFVYALLARPDGVLAASGNRAGLFLIERGGASQWLSTAQGQFTALAARADGATFAATSNPAVLWRLGPGRAARGELTGPALDARRMARFGRLAWRGSAGGGRVELYARSGNTDPPDTTWSPWRGGATDPAGREAGAPPARYLQWRIALEGGAPRVESVSAAWREQNLPPRLEDLAVAPQGVGFREGELTPRSEAVTQQLPGGQKVEFSLSAPANPRQLRELPMWARGLRTAQWKGSDPNGDPLVYRVDAAPDGGGPWLEVAKDLTQAAVTWDTQAVPDGRWRLRVTASDAAANALGEEGVTELVSEPFTVDNTPPTIPALEARGEAGSLVVEGRAEDAVGPVSRLELSVDDGDWRAVTPDGGLADDPVVTFRVRLPAAAGERTIAVRAVDLAGNAAVRTARATVPARR
uniref:WD40 repeat domain-containing protein n=1 Tax=Eiseniibacteriota bacterium TaxID=2212470 RepID=A0A832I0L9_UNCEI